MAVTQSKRCHENDEAASVRRVWCRVGSEASLKQVVAQIVTELQVTMYIRSVHCSLCTDVSESAFIRLVVTAPLTSSKKQESSHSSHGADLVDLHMLVAELGDVSNGAVKSDSLMEQGVVGRDQARPVAKPAQPVQHRERHQEQDRESHRETLARVKEFVGDDEKLFAECQQDTDADIDIDFDI